MAEADTTGGFARLFDRPTSVYIDYANARKWSGRLGWQIDLERLKILFDSIPQVKNVRFYFGTIEGDKGSAGFIRRVQRIGFDLRTKPVKTIRLSVDVSSISEDSPDILRSFISPQLLGQLKVETIKYLNEQLRDLNKQGLLRLDIPKCNFDVEIATDMRLAHQLREAEGFCLWSGDSDFEDPVRELLQDGKKVILVATARKVASELNALRKLGLVVYEVNKLRRLIERTMPAKSKGDSD